MPSPQQDDPLDQDQDIDMDRRPLDPFPTLLSSLRTHITRPAIPTYAAIARSPSNPTRPALAPEVPVAGPSTVWSADDIDRDDRLDEIRSFPSSPVVFRVSPPAQPVAGPSSSTAASTGDSNRGVEAGIDALPVPTQLDAAPVPGSILSPLTARRATPRLIGTPTPGEDSIDEIVAAMREEHRQNERPQTVNPNPPSDPIGEAMETIFGGTWNEGMVAAARHLTQPINGNGAQNANRNPDPLEARTIPLRRRQEPRTRRLVDAPVPNPNPDTRTMDERVAEVVRMRNELREMREREEAASLERERVMGRARERIAAVARGLTPRRLRENRYGQDQGEGGGAANIDTELDPYDFVRRLGPDRLDADTSDDDDGSVDIETEAEFNERSMLQRMRQETEAIANARNDVGNFMNPPPRADGRLRTMQTVRRTVPRAPLFPNTFTTTPLGIQVDNSRGTGTGAAQGAAQGPGPEGVGRTAQPFYAHPNITGDIDIDAWETAFGDDPPVLRRGGNNRRRGTGARPQSSHLPRVHGATETTDVRPLLRAPGGLLPTNRYSHTSNFSDVAVVTSRRRDRVEGEIQMGESGSEESAQESKRRRFTVEPMLYAEPTQKYPRQSDWPSYLQHNLYKYAADKFLPLKFESTNETFLKVTHSSIGRPIVQFIDHPQLTATDSDASNIGTTVPIPVGLGIFYYEVECISDGIEGFMSVGWKMGGIRKNRLIGWDKGTFGWHSDDGMCFEQSGSGSAFAAKWGPGDTVGLGIDFTTGRAFFTKNGSLIGDRFKNLGAGLRPAVGLRSQGEELCINFNGPFRFDIDTYVGKIKDKFTTEVSELQVSHVPRLSPWKTKGQYGEAKWRAMCEPGEENLEPMHRVGWDDEIVEPVLPELPATSALRGTVEGTTAAFVLNYLTHHGYTSTLESTRQEMTKRNWLSPPTIEDIPPPSEGLAAINQINRQILDLSGPMPIELILETINELMHESRTLNTCRVHQFIHLIRRPRGGEDDDMAEAIAYGKSLRERQLGSKYPFDPCDLELFERAAGFIAIPFDEAQVKIWDRHRRRLAAELDKFLRITHGLHQESILQKSVKQVQAVNQVMAERDPSTTFVDVRRQIGLD